MIRAVLGRSDPWIVVAVLLLAPFGVLMIHSATVDAERMHVTTVDRAVIRQLVVAVFGLSVMIGLSRMDYRALRRLALPAYVGTLVLLALVLLVGITQFGARRWIGIGGFTLQPSEFTKLTLVIAAAAYLADRPQGPRATLMIAALVLAPVSLVVLQPDTGTTLVLIGASAAVVVAWGAPWRTLGTVLAIALALTPLIFAVAVPGYQRERIAVFLDPGRDPLGSGFDLQQAEVALRSGGLVGRHVFDRSDSALAFVSARSSDFMLSHIGEQVGLLGAVALLSLLALLVWRGLSAALTAPDSFGRLLAAGLTFTIFSQAAIHIAANLRALPATGIPMPFVSQGGSSLLVMCVVAGLLLSISSHQRANPGEQWSATRWQ